MLSNKKLNPILTELFIRERKLDFAVSKNIRLTPTHSFIMKIPNKWELQQITFNHSSDTRLYEFLQKMYCKTIFYFSDWCYCCIRQSFMFQIESFRKNIKTSHETIDDKITDEKLQYDINREAAKMSALKNEYLIGEEILPSGQKIVIEQGKFTYSPLRKDLKKQKRLKIKEKSK